MAGSVALLAGALQRAQMAIAHGASGTATRGRSTSTDRKRGWRPWQNPLTEVMKGAFYRIFGELDLPARYRYTTVLWPLSDSHQPTCGDGGRATIGAPLGRASPADGSPGSGPCGRRPRGGVPRPVPGTPRLWELRGTLVETAWHPVGLHPPPALQQPSRLPARSRSRPRPGLPPLSPEAGGGTAGPGGRARGRRVGTPGAPPGSRAASCVGRIPPRVSPAPGGPGHARVQA